MASEYLVKATKNYADKTIVDAVRIIPKIHLLKFKVSYPFSEDRAEGELTAQFPAKTDIFWTLERLMIKSEDIYSIGTVEQILVKFDEPIWSVCSDKVNP